MPSVPSLLTLIHVVGLVLGVGSATSKLVLLLKGKADKAFLPGYIAASRPLTKLIILGLVLLILSGIGWLIVGYEFSLLLFIKITMVAAIGVLGPIIDNVVEPKFRKLALEPGGHESPDFLQVQREYVRLEIVATGLFYAIIVMWMLVQP
jgi:hypothetical protein